MKIAKELPNILCFFRIFVSVFIAMLLTPPGEIVGLIYSVAFITDLLDGYAYRGIDDHPNHWFNRLPISMDPIADFVFGISGLLIGWRAGQISISTIVVIIAICISSNVALQKVKGFTWSIIANFLTYGFFVVMVFSDYIVWRVYASKWYTGYIGFFITMITFYIVYFIVKSDGRVIRRKGE